MPVQPQDDRFSIDYSLGQVSGHVALDTVSLGQPPIRVIQQAMGLATNSTADFSTTSCDGVFVRLPLPSHLPGGTVSVVEGLSAIVAWVFCHVVLKPLHAALSRIPLCHDALVLQGHHHAAVLLMPCGDTHRCTSSLMTCSLSLQHDQVMSPEGTCI